ncbi:DHH family phosphoesterase [Desulfovibrio sp. SGI.169]|uniref:DHH family phosphoesterase n=1 Tax=Desulfovibrio sp. SGI.169 TaxID=3420561 RepID=UPI003D01DC58
MPQTELIPARFYDGAFRMVAALRGLDRVLLAGHVHPDGDAVGSLAAAGHILRALGKEFILYSGTGLPQYLRFFPLPGTVRTSLEHLPFTPRCALLLDCGEPHRLGGELAERLPDFTTLNIDHHLGGDGMGSLANWVEPAAAATAQLMAYIALAAGLPLQGDLARAVALGVITDTGGFCHGNTSAAVFALCAHLVENGCNLTELRERLENNWTLGRMRLWGRLMERARLERGGEVAFCLVTLKDLRQCRALKEDLEGFVDQLRRLGGVRVAAVLREEEPGICRFSLRSYGDTDVRATAAALGGGGHLNAAGGALNQMPEQAASTLLAAINAQLDKEDAASAAAR